MTTIAAVHRAAPTRLAAVKDTVPFRGQAGPVRGRSFRLYRRPFVARLQIMKN